MYIYFYPPILCHNPENSIFLTITGDPITTWTFYYGVTAIAVFWDGRGTAICHTVSRVPAMTGGEAVLHAVFPRDHIRSCSFRDASYQRGQWVPPTVYITLKTVTPSPLYYLQLSPNIQKQSPSAHYTTYNWVPIYKNSHPPPTLLPTTESQ
jgi:hypothetical protein